MLDMPVPSGKFSERRRRQKAPSLPVTDTDWRTPARVYLMETAGTSSVLPSPGPVLAAACNLEETLRDTFEQELEDLESQMNHFGEKFAELLRQAKKEAREEYWDEFYEKVRRRRVREDVDYRRSVHEDFREFNRLNYETLLDMCWDRIDEILRVKPRFFKRHPREHFNGQKKRTRQAQKWLNDVFNEWWECQDWVIERNPPMFDDPNVTYPCWNLAYLFKQRVAEKVTYPDIGFTVRWEDTRAPALGPRLPEDPDYWLCVSCEAGNWRCRAPIGQECARCTRLGLECIFPWPQDSTIRNAMRQKSIAEKNRSIAEKKKSQPLSLVKTEPSPLLDTETEPFPLLDTQTEPFPLLDAETETEPFPLLDTETEPFPLLDTETEPFPLLDTETEPCPLFETDYPTLFEAAANKYQTTDYDELTRYVLGDYELLLEAYAQNLENEKECREKARKSWSKMLYVGGEAQFVETNEKIWPWALPAKEFDDDKKKWVPKTY